MHKQRHLEKGRSNFKRVTLAGNEYPPKFMNKVLSLTQKQNPTNEETTKGIVVGSTIHLRDIAELEKDLEYICIQITNYATEHTHED
jgi:hypothetical protein